MSIEHSSITQTRTRRTPSPPPPKFKNVEERLKSFRNVYWPSDINAQPENLTKAGFYFVGPNDRVKCGFCGGILKKWRIDDTPIDEHCKHFPNCLFVKRFESASVVLCQKIRDQSKINTYIDSEELIKRTSEYREQNKKSTPYEMVMTTLLKMGFKKAIIEKANIKCNAEMLLPNIKNMLRTIQQFEKELYFQNLETCDELKQTVTEETINKNEYVQELENDRRILTKERNELIDQLNCKICLLNKIDTLFIKCCHLVACKHCANKLKDCPICRVVILGTVDIFMC